MSINRNTYEIYLIDYLEGNLDAVQVSELLLFLEQNPDLKTEFENLELVYLTQESIQPLDKTTLKKPAFDEVKDRQEHLLIAQLEGDLTQEETLEINRAKALYPELHKQEQLFALTKLSPDLSVQFPRKNNLKRFVLAAYYPNLVKVAAILILLSSVGFYVWKSTPTPVVVQQVPSVNPLKNIPQQNPTPLASSKNKTNRPATTITNMPTTSVEEQSSTNISTRKSISPIELNKVEKILVQTALVPNAKQLSRIDEPTASNYALPVLPTPTIQPLIAALTPASTDKDEFISVKEWIRHKINNTLKTENVVAGINKTGTTVHFNRDSVSGKITRFEIAGIGFERTP